MVKRLMIMLGRVRKGYARFRKRAVMFIQRRQLSKQHRTKEQVQCTVYNKGNCDSDEHEIDYNYIKRRHAFSSQELKGDIKDIMQKELLNNYYLI